MDKKWKCIIWLILTIWMVLVVGMGVAVTIGHAQVTPGTVNAKVDDGVGNKITSTVSGPSRGLDVNCIGGCAAGGVSYLDADAIVNQTTTAVHGQTYMYNGVTWDRVRGTIAGGLQVNCVTGCAGGSSTPTDAFANPTTAGIQQTFGMVYNGATWDLMRGTVGGGVLVNVSNASLAVTGTFFQATQPVSIAGTVAVTQSGVWSTGRTWTLASGTDSVAAVQSGAWSVGVTGTATIAGEKSNNAVVPGATNLGVLPCVATTVAPTYTDTFQVGCSTNTSGGTRSDITQIVGVTPGATNALPVQESNGVAFYSSDTINGIVYKKVSSVQDIELSASNSSTANLAVGALFTGTSSTTLGVGSIQINIFSDQGMNIQVQQAQQDPGVNWDIIDTWNYLANSSGNDAARTIQATGASVRVIVTNIGNATTTVLRLITALCPICDTLPRGLTQAGNLKAAIVEPAPILNTVPVFIINSSIAQFPPAQVGLNKLTQAAQNAAYCRKILCPPLTGGLR